MIRIELQVLWCTDEMHEKIKMNLDYDIEGSELKPHTFYVISHIRPYNEKYCTVVSDGIIYLVNETYESVDQKIAAQLIFKWN